MLFQLHTGKYHEPCRTDAQQSHKQPHIERVARLRCGRTCGRHCGAHTVAANRTVFLLHARLCCCGRQRRVPLTKGVRALGELLAAHTAHMPVIRAVGAPRRHRRMGCLGHRHRRSNLVRAIPVAEQLAAPAAGPVSLGAFLCAGGRHRLCLYKRVGRLGYYHRRSNLIRASLIAKQFSTHTARPVCLCARSRAARCHSLRLYKRMGVYRVVACDGVLVWRKTLRTEGRVHRFFEGAARHVDVCAGAVRCSMDDASRALVLALVDAARHGASCDVHHRLRRRVHIVNGRHVAIYHRAASDVRLAGLVAVGPCDDIPLQPAAGNVGLCPVLHGLLVRADDAARYI